VLSTARCSAVPVSPPRYVPCGTDIPTSPRTVLARTDFLVAGMAAYCSVPLRIDIPPRRAPYWPVQTVSAGGFPKARFTLVIWQCSVWHCSLLGVTLSFPPGKHLASASYGVTWSHHVFSLVAVAHRDSCYCPVLFNTVCSIAVLAGSFPTNREPIMWLVACGLLPLSHQSVGRIRSIQRHAVQTVSS
jgi:hypothetical protein